MLRGFWKLSWVETKVFVREPMGVVGTVAMPAILFIALGRMMGAGRPDSAVMDEPPDNWVANFTV